MRPLQKLYLFVFAFAFINIGDQIAQDNSTLDRHPSTDSLFSEIKNTKEDTLRLDLYDDIIRANLYYDLELSKTCADTSHKLALQLGEDYYIANSYHQYGLYYRFTGNVDSSFYFFNKALEVFGPTEDETKMTGTLFNIGVLQATKGEHDKALECFLKLKDIYEDSGNLNSLCQTYSSIGSALLEMKEFEQALPYLEKAVQIANQIENKLSLAIALGNIQSLYSNWDKFDLCVEYGRQALKVEQELGGAGGIGFVSNILSTCFRKQSELDSARYYAEVAVNALEKGGEAVHLSEAYTVVGNLNNELKNYDEAISSFKKSEAINEKGEYGRMKLMTYEGLYTAYELKGNDKKSLEYSKKFISLADSIFTKDKIQAISEMEAKYQGAKKDALLATKESTIAKQKSQRNNLIGGLFILGLISIVLFLRFKSRQKIASQEIELLKKERKLLSIDYIVQGQEEERKRIAQDLHDGLGGILSTAKLQMKNIQAEIEKLESLSLVSKAEDLIDNAYNEVRRISHDMMPGALVNLGLFAAIEDLAEQVSLKESLSIKTQWYASDEDIQSKDQSIIYRIVQEVITNAVKYSQAGNMLIQMTRTNDTFNLIIEDDGIGFDIEKTTSQGLGIKGIKSRVDYLNGEAEIISRPGKGVCYEITIPVK